MRVILQKNPVHMHRNLKKPDIVTRVKKLLCDVWESSDGVLNWDGIVRTKVQAEKIYPAAESEFQTSGAFVCQWGSFRTV